MPVFNSGATRCPSLEAAPACSFPNTLTGAGNSGYVFGLDLSQAAAVQALIAPGYRIRLTANLSDAPVASRRSLSRTLPAR
jgi:hypothetical protein